jgi:hypothetical protein
MINLLSDNTKQQIRAARTNVILVNYMIFLGFALVFLVLACSATYLFLLNTKAINEEKVEVNQSKTTPYSLVETQADTLRNSLSTAKSILDQQVSYSSIIMGIAAALPTEVVLDSLSLSSSTFGTPITLKMHATSNDMTELEKSFNANSTLFSDYKLQSIGQHDSSGYPVIISITINKGAAQ